MPAPANPSAQPEAGSLREAAAAIAKQSTTAAPPAQPASPEVTTGRMKVVSTPVADPSTLTDEGTDDADDAPETGSSRIADPDDFEAEDDSVAGAADPDDDLGEEGLSVRSLPPERLDETFTVKAANGIQKVSLKQLIRSHAHVAEGVAQAQAARQERAAIDQAAGVYLNRLRAVEEVLGKLNGTERTQEQWQELYRTNPMEYMRERDVARERQEQLRLVQQERQQAEQHRQALRQQQISEVVQAEAARLVEKFPKLADPQMATKFQNAVVGYLKQSLGATDQELSQLLDHRLFVLAYKAYRYDKGKTMQKSVKAKAVDAPPVAALAPGQPKPAAVRNEGPVKKALSNLRQTGSVADAAALISARNKQRR